MTTTGNGQPLVNEIPPWAKAAKQAPAERKLPEPAARTDPAPANAVDFLARVNDAAALLADVGTELGAVGQDDSAALRQFAEQMQANTRRYIGGLIERKRRELADLERILGRL